MIDKPCEICGVMLYHVAQSRKYCPECAHEALLAQRREQRIKRGAISTYYKKKTDQTRKTKKQTGLSLNEIAALANAAGMTYAKYVEKFGV
jgi:uncharacterized Zn finger protein (UPF0148 family)